MVVCNRSTTVIVYLSMKMVLYFVKVKCFHVVVITGCRLVVLDAGQVSECDLPTALLNNSNTQFYAMAKDSGIVA